MEIPEWVDRDPEWRAAVHILSAPILKRKAWPYVDFIRREIHFPDMVSGGWSHGEVVLMRAAWDLFSGAGECSLGELVRTLDDENLSLILEALALYRPIQS